MRQRQPGRVQRLLPVPDQIEVEQARPPAFQPHPSAQRLYAQQRQQQRLWTERGEERERGVQVFGLTGRTTDRGGAVQPGGGLNLAHIGQNVDGVTFGARALCRSHASRAVASVLSLTHI